MPTATATKESKKSKSPAAEAGPRPLATVPREALLPAVETAVKASRRDRSNDHYMYADITLTDDGNILIECCSGETWCRREIPGFVVVSGRFNVLAHTLADVVKKLPDGDITIEADPAACAVTLSQGSSRYTIKGNADREYAPFPVPPPEGVSTFSVGFGRLREVLDTVSFACSREASRVILTGINWKGSGESITLAATDTKRIAINSFDCKSPAFEITLLEDGLSLFIGMAVEDDQAVEITLGGGRGYFSTPGTLVICSTAKGAFPNYERIIPTDVLRSWMVKAEDFTDLLKRALMFARDNANRVILSRFNGMLTVSARSEAKGECWVRCDMVEGSTEEDHRQAFNAAYLADAARHAPKTDGAINIHSNESHRAILITREGDPDWMCVIMPMALEGR